MWKLEANERISQWRDFRKTLSSLTLNRALESTVDFWQSCPHHPFYLDPERPDDWPTPWQLIADNYYCDLAKALGMLYTVYLTCRDQIKEAEIRVYYDPESRYTYNLAIFDQGKYVLNFIDGKVVNISSVNKRLKLKYQFSSMDLKLEQY